MKLKILSLILFAPLFLFSQNELQKELSQLIDQWHLAAANADQATYFNIIADKGVFIGTDSSENWTKQEFQEWSKPYFERDKAWTLKANSRNIYIHESKQFAWFDELLYMKSSPWIGSGVLVKENNEWKIAHYTLSLTIPNDKLKKVNQILIKE